MNPAPAELLQLLKSAALQLSSSPTTETTKVRWFNCCSHRCPREARKEKAAMPEINSGNAACSFREAYVHTE
ncbi:hypothetical protein [Massilia sp. WG5]|uniref:hypothetical protein n=1 Tax=Massilia sp. WG5 TaxID=1707785 RepID=UPI0013A5A2A1|nr:hypothetical protein [Massilia sp. WG5]